MSYTRTKLETVMDNISGPLPSDIFESFLDSFSATFVEMDERVFVHRCTTSTDIDEYVVMPFAGKIKKIYSVINGAIGTDDETLVFKNGTDSLGTITIANSGSAAGDVDSLTPSANNSFSAGDALLIEIGGESTGDAQCDLTIIYELT